MPRSDSPSFSWTRSAFGPLRDPRDEVLVVHEVRDKFAGLVVDGDDEVRDLLLLRERGARRGLVEEPGDVERRGVVDRRSVLEVALHPVADEEDVGEERGVAHLPVVVLLRGALDDTALDDPVLELGEADLLVVAGDDGAEVRISAEGDGLLALLHDAPVAVQPLQVHGVVGVLLALEPVAGQFSDADVRVAVLVRVRLPHRDERRRGRDPYRPRASRPSPARGIRRPSPSP